MLFIGSKQLLIRYYLGVILHQDNKGQAPPSGYVDISGPKEFYCARSFGDCGAKAPIYRYRNRNQLINSKNKDIYFRSAIEI